MSKPTVPPLCLAVLVALTGCSSPDAAMKSFMGQPSSTLVTKWGPPQMKVPDAQGGEIWSYFEQKSWSTSGQTNSIVYSGFGSGSGDLTTSYTPPSTRDHTLHGTFFIDDAGIIYNYGGN